MKRRRILKALFNSCGGVTIVGDDAFVRATTAALELLKNRTPDVYALLQKHVGCVVSSKPTRVSIHFLAACCLTSLLAYAPTTVVLMRLFGSELPIEERAGILAHETYHAELYIDTRKTVILTRRPLRMPILGSARRPCASRMNATY